jgi:hypothetical protein
MLIVTAAAEADSISCTCTLQMSDVRKCMHFQEFLVYVWEGGGGGCGGIVHKHPNSREQGFPCKNLVQCGFAHQAIILPKHQLDGV